MHLDEVDPKHNNEKDLCNRVITVTKVVSTLLTVKITLFNVQTADNK